MMDNNLKKLFSLEITGHDNKIKISAYEKLHEYEKAIRHYEIKEINIDEINNSCSTIVNIFNSMNKRGEPYSHKLKELQAIGQLLYDCLLTPQVKRKLSETTSGNLIIIVDDSFIHIPWELLYDGTDFLCRKFNMGRLVNTGQHSSNPSLRKVKVPVKMLIVADPRDDLKSAYNEGVSLRDELDSNLDSIKVNLKSSVVNTQSIKEEIRYYDILHYAGHADYDSHSPSDSGFLLEDGKFKASDIVNMIGPSPLPALIFSNACKSAHTEKWRIDENFENEIHGLANAFLLAGVQHYIGTFWDIQDGPGLHFAVDFYKSMMNGSSVGGALNTARTGLIKRYGENSLVWASYILYGDPTSRYIDLADSSQSSTSESQEENNSCESKMELTGTVRGTNSIKPAGGNIKKWILIAPVLLIILSTFITMYVLGVWQERPVDESTGINEAQYMSEKKKRIDKLVAELIKNYNENEKAGKKSPAATDKSGPPSLVFLNIKSNGISDSDKEFIMTMITNRLSESKKVHIIEREILDQLLAELKLSSSRLANPSKALEVGKILSAQMISTGSIIRDSGNWQVSLRFIDTETTSILAALTRDIKTDDRSKVAELLSDEILNKIR